jgi:hypothetical protein
MGLPAPWVNFTYEPEEQSPTDFAPIEQQFGLVLLGTEEHEAQKPTTRPEILPQRR